MSSSERKWRSSESIALQYLEKAGYKILETRKKIKIEGVEVGEVDAVAEGPDGNLYVVEIKAGRVDVTGIRQIYVNAQLLGYKPLVVAKGFADNSSKMLADKLGVPVIELSDAFLVDAEELEIVVESALYRILSEWLKVLVTPLELGPQEWRIVEALAKSSDVKDFADLLGLSVEDAMREIARLRNKGFPSWGKSYWAMRPVAQLLIIKRELENLKRLIASSARLCRQGDL